MLRKLLFQHQDKRQLIIAIVGAFLGMTFLITSIHFLIRVDEFGEGKDILGPNTIIVQKEISKSSILNLSKTDFSQSEINSLKEESFITDVQPVITNNFDVSLETSDPMVPRFRTDVFIQTVDPDFLDIKSAKFKWKEGDTIVPMIMPREFLVMLNTFMSASGIPQVSDELAMDIRFRFTLKNEDESRKEWVTCRIVGFTNEVSSMLVPESFMSWANNRFAEGVDQKITQLMISGEENNFGLVEELMTRKHYESKKTQMIVGQLKSIVGTLILIVLAISIIAVFLAGLVLIQYLQLLLNKNAYEIRTLLRLGHHPKSITRAFVIYFIKVFGIITIGSTLLFLFFKLKLDQILHEGGIFIETGITLSSILALFLAYIIFTFSAFVSAKRGVSKTNNG